MNALSRRGVLAAAISCLAVGPWSVMAAQGRSLVLQRVRLIEGREADLFAVTDAVTLSDESIVTVAMGRSDIRRFTAEGGMESFGRAGSGPGEFRSLIRVGEKRDSLWVFDPVLQRLSILTARPRFRFERSFQWPPGQILVRTIGAVKSPLPIGFAPDGGALSLGLAVPANSPPIGVVLQHDSQGHGAVVRGLRHISSQCRAMLPDGRQFTRAFCGGFLSDHSRHDGSFVVIANVSAGPSSTFKATVIASNGDTVWTRVVSRRSDRVDAVARDSALARVRQSLKLDDRDAHAAETIIARDAFYPAASAVRLAEDRRVWVKQDSRSGSHWLVLGREGQVEGIASLAPGEEPLAMSGTMLWTTSSDEDGFINLTKYLVRF